MFSEPVAVAGDLDHDGVMQQPIQERGGHHGVAEHLAPLAEAAIGRQDDRAALVAGVDELEELVRAALLNGQVLWIFVRCALGKVVNASTSASASSIIAANFGKRSRS